MIDADSSRSFWVLYAYGMPEPGSLPDTEFAHSEEYYAFYKAQGWERRERLREAQYGRCPRCGFCDPGHAPDCSPLCEPAFYVADPWAEGGWRSSEPGIWDDPNAVVPNPELLRAIHAGKVDPDSVKGLHYFYPTPDPARYFLFLMGVEIPPRERIPDCG